MKQFYFLLLVTIFLISCSTQKNVVEKKQEKKNDSVQVINVPIVEKPFYNKVGKKMDFTEFYVQQSVQDYFIKFCESKVSREELEAALSKIESPIKTLTVEVEFKEGLWDSCEDYEVQSRVGKYVVLHEIK